MITVEQGTKREDEMEASAAWRRASDAVLAGIGHDMSGRISSLLGLVQLGRLDGQLDEMLGEVLEREVLRLEELLRLLRQMPGGRAGREEPLLAAELLEAASALLRRHRGIEDVRVRTEGLDALPPVAGRQHALSRALLLLLAGAARAAVRSGSYSIAVSAGRDGEAISLRIAPEPPGEAGGEVEREPWEEEALDAVRSVLARSGGNLVVSAGAVPADGAAVEVRLPVWPEEVQR